MFYVCFVPHCRFPSNAYSDNIFLFFAVLAVIVSPFCDDGCSVSNCCFFFLKSLSKLSAELTFYWLLIFPWSRRRFRLPFLFPFFITGKSYSIFLLLILPPSWQQFAASCAWRCQCPLAWPTISMHHFAGQWPRMVISFLFALFPWLITFLEQKRCSIFFIVFWKDGREFLLLSIILHFLLHFLITQFGFFCFSLLYFSGCFHIFLCVILGKEGILRCPHTEFKMEPIHSTSLS